MLRIQLLAVEIKIWRIKYNRRINKHYSIQERNHERENSLSRNLSLSTGFFMKIISIVIAHCYFTDFMIMVAKLHSNLMPNWQSRKDVGSYRILNILLELERNFPFLSQLFRSSSAILSELKKILEHGLLSLRLFRFPAF